MKTILSCFSAVVLALPAAAQTPTPPRPIDLAICLDVSGSMDGLIDAARQNLWSVVNELARLQPAPQLRVALLTYGCSAYEPATGWVKVDVEFTSDLDLVSERLFALRTNGGEELVARVVRAATEQLAWSDDGQALKLLFVAGNEAATQDSQNTTEVVARAAIAKGIVVNSIFCGAASHRDAGGWRDVARFADGQFAAIDHNNAVVVTTPFDARLQELSTALNTTYVPYGAEAGAWVDNQIRQDANAASLNVAAAAQRCQVKGSALYDNRQWDLVDACKDPKFVLAEVKKEDLPEALRSLELTALRAHVDAQAAKRTALSRQVTALGKQRDAFVQRQQAQQQAQQQAAGQFENAVLEAVRQQAKAAGFVLHVPAQATLPAAEPEAVDPELVAAIALAAADYDSFPRVTGAVRVAPTDCRAPAPRAVLSRAEKVHGGKLYMLFARLAKGEEYVVPGAPAAIGETLVKEAWEAVAGHATAATPASERYGMAPVAVDGEQRWHAGAFAGLFVMHKLAADTPGTDQGWVYGTIDANGVVTAAGKIASCVKCHQDATEDRRFGLR